MTALSQALQNLERRYAADEQAWKMAEDDGSLPLWLTSADKRAAHALLLAKRDICRDLLGELGAQPASVVVEVCRKELETGSAISGGTTLARRVLGLMGEEP